MDAETLPYALDFVASSGICLSPEKRAALRNSLMLVRRDYRFEQVRLWGRIQGIRAAYYIAEGLGHDRAGIRSRLYSLNCVDWSLLPPAKEEMITVTAPLKGRFQGDPSYEYEPTDKKEEGERSYEEEVGPLVKEEIRLVATIHQIDKEVGIVPRGAYVKSPLGPVHENRSFEGLSLTEAKKLSSYFHFTDPVNLKNKTLLEKADLDPAIDFLDSLEHDIPKDFRTLNCCINQDPVGGTQCLVALRKKRNPNEIIERIGVFSEVCPLVSPVGIAAHQRYRLAAVLTVEAGSDHFIY